MSDRTNRKKKTRESIPKSNKHIHTVKTEYLYIYTFSRKSNHTFFFFEKRRREEKLVVPEKKKPKEEK